MDQQVTDALTAAAAAWTTLALQQLDPKCQDAAVACTQGQDLDMHVVIRLRRGAVELEGTDERAGKRITLYREEVAPMRLSTPFALPDADTKEWGLTDLRAWRRLTGWMKAVDAFSGLPTRLALKVVFFVQIAALS
jgi:hypothetical protein